MKRLIALLATVSVIAGAVYFFTRPKDDFASGQAGPETIIAVEEGTSGAQIATILKDAGVVKTRQAFINVVYSDQRARRIQPGGYRLQTKIPASVALDQLLDPTRRIGVVTFPEGLRASEVIKRLEGADIDVKNALSDLSLPFGAKKVEGFLHPGQYAFTPGTTGAQAIAKMIERFHKRTAQLAGDAKALGWTPYEGLIVASLLQAEGIPADHAKILRVILNRQAIGMPLQIDATVLYALNESGRIRVTNRDLQVNSPYNTYKYKGLPPTPINNPGDQAIAALASPAQGNWLYYITVKPGDTRFTRSHDQFVQWKVEFRANYRAGLFG